MPERDPIQVVNESVVNNQRPRLITETQEYGTGNSLGATVNTTVTLIKEEGGNEKED